MKFQAYIYLYRSKAVELSAEEVQLIAHGALPSVSMTLAESSRNHAWVPVGGLRGRQSQHLVGPHLQNSVGIVSKCTMCKQTEIQ